MTYPRRWLMVLTCLALVAPACAGDPDDTGGDQTTGGTVEIAAVWSGDEKDRFEDVLAAFEEESGTSVTFTSTGDAIATALRTRIAGGDPPALAILPQPGLMNDLVAQDALQPIDDVVGDAVDEDWAPIWRDLGSVDGSLYGLFYKAANKSTVWYNVQAFEDAGVEPPADWDEFQSTMQALSDSGVTPLAVPGGDAWTLTDWFENIYIRSAGADLYDQLVDHEIPWTHDSVKEALRLFGEVVDDKAMLLEDPTSLEFVPAVDAVFKSPPDAAMIYEGDFVPGQATVEAEAQEDYDVFDFPAIDGSQPSVVGAGDIVVMMEDSEPARALLEFLATPEAAEIWAAEGGFASPNQAVDESAYPNDIIRQTATALAEAETFRFDLSDLVPTELGGDVPGSMWSILQEFVQDPSDVDGTAQRLEDTAATAYGQ